MGLYLTTEDPAVIAALERNRQARIDYKARALAWAAGRGADAFFPSNFAGRWTVRGLPIQPEGFGRWTKGDHRGCHRPFANNAVERKAMAALAFTEEEVPGLPVDVVSVHDSEGRAFLMWPTPIVHDGAAWVEYPHQPEPKAVEQIGPQWSECLASKYHAAREAVESA